MTQDPLAQYRRTPTIPPGGVQPSGENEAYAAFGTKDKVHRLRIRSAKALTHSPGYNLLLDIVYDGGLGTNFVLMYTVLMVMVKGKNLQKLVFAIENGMADYIQEYDPARWAKPTDASAAVIDSIEIKLVEASDGDKQGDTRH